MKKNYITLLLITLSLFAAQHTIAQNKDLTTHSKENIKDLTIYPNPVKIEDTYLYITSKTNASKYVEIHNILGKLLFSTNIIGKQLNISQFNKGVYILKITENNQSTTKKLIIQ